MYVCMYIYIGVCNVHIYIYMYVVDCENYVSDLFTHLCESGDRGTPWTRWLTLASQESLIYRPRSKMVEIPEKIFKKTNQKTTKSMWRYQGPSVVSVVSAVSGDSNDPFFMVFPWVFHGFSIHHDPPASTVSVGGDRSCEWSRILLCIMTYHDQSYGYPPIVVPQNLAVIHWMFIDLQWSLLVIFNHVFPGKLMAWLALKVPTAPRFLTNVGPGLGRVSWAETARSLRQCGLVLALLF